jgi:hypothetical protein
VHTEREVNRREILRILLADGNYEPPPYENLPPARRAQLDAYNLTEMLQEALEPGHLVDYAEVTFILSRLSALQMPDLIPIVLQNIERLYPVAGSVAAFFGRFAHLAPGIQREVASSLLRPLQRRRGVTPPEYYAMWILHLFHQNPAWDHADGLLQVFNTSNSPVIRRYAALALATSGTRAQVIQLRGQFQAAHPLVRTAILMASHRMGTDERRFWRTGLGLTDWLEREL